MSMSLSAMLYLIVHFVQVYGDVHRALDCYRLALYLESKQQHNISESDENLIRDADRLKSSIYINIMGMLDQMGYQEDAIEVFRFQSSALYFFLPLFHSLTRLDSI